MKPGAVFQLLDKFSIDDQHGHIPNPNSEEPVQLKSVAFEEILNQKHEIADVDQNFLVLREKKTLTFLLLTRLVYKPPFSSLIPNSRNRTLCRLHALKRTSWLLTGFDNAKLTSMNNVLGNMDNVELASMNNVLASMFYRFPTILFIHPLNGQPHLNFIFCRIMMTTRKMIKSHLKYRLQREF